MSTSLPEMWKLLLVVQEQHKGTQHSLMVALMRRPVRTHRRPLLVHTHTPSCRVIPHILYNLVTCRILKAILFHATTCIWLFKSINSKSSEQVKFFRFQRAGRRRQCLPEVSETMNHITMKAKADSTWKSSCCPRCTLVIHEHGQEKAKSTCGISINKSYCYDGTDKLTICVNVILILS